MFGVNDFVEKSVQLINLVMVWERESIGTFVAVWVRFVVATFTVERLVDVSHVVDEEAERVRFGVVLVAWVQAVLHVIIHVRVLVVSAVFAREPISDVLDGKGQVTRLHVRDVVIAGFALLNVGNVDEVVVGLPGTTVIFDIVGERGALHERVSVFVANELRIRVFQELEHLVGGVQC